MLRKVKEARGLKREKKLGMGENTVQYSRIMFIYTKTTSSNIRTHLLNSMLIKFLTFSWRKLCENGRLRIAYLNKRKKFDLYTLICAALIPD